MKRKTKLKHLEGDHSQDGSCHGNDAGTDGPAVRRSSRKRSVPKEFAPVKTKKSIGYWSIKQKEILLQVLGELNERKLTYPNVTYRYPIQIIKKRVGGKTLADVRRFMSMLENRAAKVALTEMKQQPPLESWRQMSDKMTVLTGDDCCRHLIRVCSIMALESKDKKDDDASEHGKGSGTTSAAAAATSAPPSKSAEPATPATSALMTLACQALQADASRAGPPYLLKSPEAVASSSATTNAGTASDAQTPASVAAAEASSVRGDAAAAAAAADDDGTDIQLIPDYASIYKYIASIMRGERKDLGPLESLVVLDCLKLVEEHLKGRDNAKEKECAQDRFTDILQKFYLSMDCEDAPKKKRTVKDGDPTEPVTMADLIGIKNQSQPGMHQVDQSGVEALLDGQPENSSGPETLQFVEEGETTNQSQGRFVSGDQSEPCPGWTSQSSSAAAAQERADSKAEFVTIPEATCKRLQLKDTGLGSLNPFSIPLSLLEIRRGK